MDLLTFDPDAALRQWRTTVLRRTLEAGILLGAIAVAASAYESIQAGRRWQVYIFLPALAWVITLRFMPRLGHRLQAHGTCAVLYGLGIYNLLQTAHTSDALILMLAPAPLAALLLGWRAAVGWIGLPAAIRNCPRSSALTWRWPAATSSWKSA